jgi:hypothetical protein
MADSTEGKVSMGSNYPIGGMPVAEVAGGREGAVLLLGMVLGPYRRGDTGAWWTILLALLLDVGRLGRP